MAAPDLIDDWRRIFHDGFSVGPRTRVSDATVLVVDPTACSFTIGSDSDIHGSYMFWLPAAHIRVGSRSMINGGVCIHAAAGVDIGDDVLIAWDVLIMDTDFHSRLFAERKDDVLLSLQNKNRDFRGVKTAPIRIADKAWIGTRAIILKGVSIGEGAIVGAGSVVTRDVPPWTIVAGNPARVVGQAPESRQDRIHDTECDARFGHSTTRTTPMASI